MNDRTTPNRPSLGHALISVVLPVYNEAEVLSLLLERIDRSMTDVGVDYEVLFVDDGSSDDSPAILDQLAAGDSRVRVIHLSRNFGHQAAVQAGLVRSRGDAVVLMDSDMQDTPETIPRFVHQWQAGYDVVYAVRTQRKEGRLKKFLFSAFHRLMSRVASVPVPVDAGNFGLIDRRVARQIAALGESDRYFPGLRSWVGFRQTGVDVERSARYDEHSRVSMRGLFRLAKTAMFSFSLFPLVIFYVIGAAATLLFVGLSCFSVYCKLFTELAIPGWTSHILIGSFFGALNALGICILGEYVIRIYDQVRGRPLYLIDRTVNMESDAPVGRSGEARKGDRTGDEPYTELMDQAADLLEAGTIREAPGQPAENAGDLPQTVLFPNTAEETT